MAAFAKHPPFLPGIDSHSRFCLRLFLILILIIRLRLGKLLFEPVNGYEISNFDWGTVTGPPIRTTPCQQPEH